MSEFDQGKDSIPRSVTCNPNDRKRKTYSISSFDVRNDLGGQESDEETMTPCKMVVTGKSESGIELLQVEGPKAEGRYSTAKISVWWDLETTFGAGKMSDPQLMMDYIHASLEKMGYTGPISTFAYGNRNLIGDSFHHALSNTDITFVDVSDGKHSICKEILEDMIFWATDNAFPANLMMISDGEKDLYVINNLKRRKYNILLARLSDTTNAGVDAT